MTDRSTLDELLRRSAARDPKALALIEPFGRTLSYGDLDAYADAIHEQLGAIGVRQGDRIGLCLPKSIGTVATLFGALRAKAAYVPVDVGAPFARNALILNDCAVKAVIVEPARSNALLQALGGDGWREVPLKTFPACKAEFVMLVRGAEAKTEVPAAPQGLSYILYTSGSTGRPKGVMHSHATALAFVDWCSEELRPTASDRFSSHAPFHFDLSILDIYVPIKHGASLVLIDAETGKQPGTLAQIIAEQGITVWYSTPAILRMLVDYGKLEERRFEKLRTVIFAGEVFPLKNLRALIARWPAPDYYNFYGPTETNVCTFHKVVAPLLEARSETLPIGAACSGDRLRVVSPEGKDVARGEEGELIAAGGSVMLGYWNLPSRDAEAFITDVDGRWYRTGDIVREVSNGEYVYVSRRDRMVKRRGYRVELGEIEAALYRHTSIGEAAVVAKTDSDGEMLVQAYLTWSETSPPSTIKLKQFMSQHVPLYMLPDRFNVLPSLPKTSTDKIDYQRLKDLA